MKKKINKIIIIDNTKERRENINTAFSNYCKNTMDYCQVNGNDALPNDYNYKKGNKVCLKDAVLLFIHIGNSFSEDFIIDAIKNYSDILIVVYTGGGADVFQNFSKNTSNCERVVFKSGISTENAPTDLNLIPALDFFATNPNDVQGFFNKILNYDPVLEAKLDFLHKCLNEKPTELPKEIANNEDLKIAFNNLPEFGSENYEQILQVFANKLFDQ